MINKQLKSNLKAVELHADYRDRKTAARAAERKSAASADKWSVLLCDKYCSYMMHQVNICGWKGMAAVVRLCRVLETSTAPVLSASVRLRRVCIADLAGSINHKRTQIAQ
jgi:hypothetical protein